MPTILEQNEETYINQLTSDPKNRIWIFSGSGFTHDITGFIDAEILFGAGASYNAEQLGKDFVDGVNSAGGNLIDAVGFKGISDKRINSVKLSRQSWQTSSFNTLAFDLFVVATKDGENPLDEGTKIFDYLLPRDFGDFMLIPGEYSVNQTGEQINATSIAIGEWFFSPEAWLMQTGSMTVSKQKQPNGVHPLFVKISITMTPARDFYAEEVKSWFKTTNATIYTPVLTAFGVAMGWF